MKLVSSQNGVAAPKADSMNSANTFIYYNSDHGITGAKDIWAYS
jgi:hypothetical protein